MLSKRHVKIIGVILVVGSTVHGLTSKKWKDAHTTGVILGLLTTL